MADSSLAVIEVEAPIDTQASKKEDTISMLDSMWRTLDKYGWTALSIIYFTLAGVALRSALSDAPLRYNTGLTSSVPQLGSKLCFSTSTYSGYFWQNALGCVCMGLVTKFKPKLNTHIAAGISTGFCGSLTTFSTWMFETAKTMLNGDVENAVLSVVCMMAVSLVSYDLGIYAGGCFLPEQPAGEAATKKEAAEEAVADEDIEVAVRAADIMGRMHDDELEDSKEDQEKSDAKVAQACVEHLTYEVLLHVGVMSLPIVIFIACITVMELHSIVDYRYLLFAPFGSIIRWLLFVAVSGLPVRFHMVHVVIANTLACAIDAGAQVLEIETLNLEYSPAAAQSNCSSDFAYLFWSGLITGTAGCLSTVSTMISELKKPELAYFGLREAYFFTMLALAAVVLLPTLGLVHCQ